MNWAVGDPFARPCLMRALVNTISVSLTVRSSSFDAPSCATDGRMQTGGTEIYCQTYSSGRPNNGSSPSNSQSYCTVNKDHNKFRTQAHLI
jgi:hypothetical protein